MMSTRRLVEIFEALRAIPHVEIIRIGSKRACRRPRPQIVRGMAAPWASYTVWTAHVSRQDEHVGAASLFIFRLIGHFLRHSLRYALANIVLACWMPAARISLDRKRLSEYQFRALIVVIRWPRRSTYPRLGWVGRIRVWIPRCTHDRLEGREAVVVFGIGIDGGHVWILAVDQLSFICRSCLRCFPSPVFRFVSRRQWKHQPSSC